MHVGSDNLKLRLDQLDANQVGNCSKGGRRRVDRSGQLHRTPPRAALAKLYQKLWIWQALCWPGRESAGNVGDAAVSKI